MKVKLLAGGVLAAALVIAGAPLGSAAAAPAATAKTTIMLAGDSLTEGLDGDYTWRYRFWSELRRQGVANVDLVGPKKKPKGSHFHYLASGWDYDHDATSGTFLKTQLPKIRDEVQRYRPDILVSYLGTNDFLEIPRSHPGAPAAELMPRYQAKVDTVLADWDTYIDTVRDVDPNIKIVLGELITPRIPVSIRDYYNDRLAELAASRSSGLFQAKIEVAQLDGQVWSSTRYLYDTLHPTPTGDTLLAQKFAEALDLVEPDLFPGSILIQRAFVAWDPVLKPKIRLTGRKVVLNWDYTARYSSVRKMRVRIGTAKAGSARMTAFRAQRSWTSANLAPGTYRIQLQGNRMAMNSTWSKVYTVTVKKPKAVTAR